MDQDEPRMTFDSDEWQNPTRSRSSQTPAIVRWVIKYSGGYVKDERQAEYVLLGFAVLAIVVAFLLIRSGGPASPIPSITTPDVLPR